MTPLNKLSRIGFGCYRISVRSKDHYDALLYALRSGCNLIDTSSNYMDGESEILVGKVLKENPSLKPFVITKAGYAQGKALTLLNELNAKGIARDEVVVMDDEFKHSIHPDFLARNLSESLARMQLKQIDCFLLHNPEYYFEQEMSRTSRQEYYQRLRRAFEFLEEKTTKGIIGAYGISSNTFPQSTDVENTTDLNRILAIAREVSADHHFRFIQFPFNLAENDALKPHHGGKSLLTVAHENNITTLANRPLNANLDGSGIRLATHGQTAARLDEKKDRLVFDRCVKLIGSQMKKQAIEDDPMDFTVIKYLSDNWMHINSTDAVEQIFSSYFYPLLNELYEGKMSPDELQTYRDFYETVIQYAMRNMHRRALDFQRQMAEQGVLKHGDTRPLTVQACAAYLEAGIDHVLVGMKRKEYVDQLKILF